MQVGDLAGSVGKGLASKVLGVKPEGEQKQARFGTLVHWGYGTGWGVVRGLLAGVGLPAGAAAVGHFGAVFGSGLVMLPRLEVAPPVKEWGATEMAIDALHHGDYAVATGFAYRWLDATSTTSRG